MSGGRRQITTTDGAEHVWTTVYDDAGRAIAQIDPLKPPHDDDLRQGRPWSPGTRMPAATRRWTHYDALGRADSTTDALSHTSATSYDAAGPSGPVRRTRSGHGVTTIYDAAGRVIDTIDARGNVSGAVYDPVATWSSHLRVGAM